jgi:DNA-binding NarL/FixJ family response regulator
MEDHAIRVLLVDDNTPDRDLILAILDEIAEARFDVVQAATLDDALAAIQSSRFDICLVDFRLGPDSGLDLIREASNRGVRIPFVLLTGFGNRDVDLAAMRAGAVGYVTKNELDAAALDRVIRYAVEGYRERAEQTRQIYSSALERFSATAAEQPHARSTDGGTLQEIDPEGFERFVRDYAELLDMALENRSYKVDHDVSGMLRAMADRLGAFMAKPRDVVQIHDSATRGKARGLPGERALTYAEEGSLLALELMGYLTAYYRGFAKAYRLEVMQQRPPAANPLPREANYGG